MCILSKNGGGFCHYQVYFFLKHHFMCLLRFLFPYGDITIIGQGLPLLTYSRQSRPFSNEGSLTCHPYCETVRPVNMVISKYFETYCIALGRGAVTTCFNDCRDRGSNPDIPHVRLLLYQLIQRGGSFHIKNKETYILVDLKYVI